MNRLSTFVSLPVCLGVAAIILFVSPTPASAESAAHSGQYIADYSDVPADLAAAATAYDIAQMKADRVSLDRLLADDYTLANSDGRNLTKAETLGALFTPERKTTHVVISEQVNKVWSGGAVLAGVVNAKGTDQGKPFAMRARFVDVWIRRDGKWQVIFTQIHDMPPKE